MTKTIGILSVISATLLLAVIDTVETAPPLMFVSLIKQINLPSMACVAPPISKQFAFVIKASSAFFFDNMPDCSAQKPITETQSANPNSVQTVTKKLLAGATSAGPREPY